MNPHIMSMGGREAVIGCWVAVGGRAQDAEQCLWKRRGGADGGVHDAKPATAERHCGVVLPRGNQGVEPAKPRRRRRRRRRVGGREGCPCHLRSRNGRRLVCLPTAGADDGTAAVLQSCSRSAMLPGRRCGAVHRLASWQHRLRNRGGRGGGGELLRKCACVQWPA